MSGLVRGTQATGRLSQLASTGQQQGAADLHGRGAGEAAARALRAAASNAQGLALRLEVREEEQLLLVRVPDVQGGGGGGSARSSSKSSSGRGGGSSSSDGSRKGGSRRGSSKYKRCRGPKEGEAVPRLVSVQQWRSGKPRAAESITLVTQLSLERWVALGLQGKCCARGAPGGCFDPQLQGRACVGAGAIAREAG